jgi:hypothetical protein
MTPFINNAGHHRPQAFVMVGGQTIGFSGNIGARVVARREGAMGFWKRKGSD